MSSKLWRVHILLTLVVVASPLGVRAQTNLRPIALSSDLNLPAPRWQMDKSTPPKEANAVVKLLRQLKQEQTQGAGDKCLSTAGTLQNLAKSLRPWIAVSELQCAMLTGKDKKPRPQPLMQALDRVDRSPDWLLHGPQKESLRQAYTAGLLDLLSREVKSSRKQAWKTIDRLVKVRGWLNKQQEGELFRIAGELAFLQQNLSLALDYYSRSFEADPLGTVKNRLDSIRAALHKDKGEPLPAEAAGVTEVLEASKEENELYERIKTALSTGDLVAAVEDSIQLIADFPGGRRSEWASDRIYEVLSNLLSKSDSKFRLLKERVVEPMLKASPSRQAAWALRLFYSGYYLEAFQLAESAVNQDKGPSVAGPLMTAAQAAVFLGDYKRATRFFERLVQQHGGTEEGAEGLFRLGLVYWRQQRMAESVAAFERLLALPLGSKWELQSRYWMWRALEKISVERAREEAQKIVERFPLTYYGLVARAQMNGNVLEFPKDDKGPIKVEIWLTETESLAWERLQILLRAGWLDEAQLEIEQLPPPQTAEEKVVRARLYALAFEHHRAITLVNEAWEQEPETLRPALFHLSFPREFEELINKSAEREKLDPQLVNALIKQESSFMPKALSPAQAAGLMQIVPVTARDSAQFLKWKKRLSLPEDLFVPETNLTFGASYLKRMVRAFDQHLPLGLAAYNLGIGRLRKWLGNRDELAKLSSTGSDNPSDGLWVDELPWSETSYYVKAVMRNYLVYQVLAKGKVSMESPHWKGALQP